MSLEDGISFPGDAPHHEKALTYGSRDRFLAEALAGVRLDISPADRAVLRPLAARVAELAARPIEDAKRELWYQHNALEATRPLVFCDLENGWREIIPPESLACRGGLARQWELILRKEIFWGSELCDDAVIHPFFGVPYVHDEIDWGLEPELIGGESGGPTAYTWRAPIRRPEDAEGLRAPRISVDHAATGQLLQTAEATFGDLLPIRLQTRWVITLGMTATLAYLRGLEQIMYDMVDKPDLIHRLMGFLSDSWMAMLDDLEARHLLNLNNDGSYVGMGGFGWTRELPGSDFAGTVRLRDMWGNAESQETTCISPRMFAEFVFPYQVRLLERFGLNCYGCCEPLDARWHVVEKIPRLRRVSVSAWANWPKMAEMLGDRYVYAMKPNPADLAMSSFDEERIRRELREAFRLTRDCRVEVIMKDNHTIRNDPRRAVRWVRIAREEAERV
jgi:hypothetical protein